MQNGSIAPVNNFRPPLFQGPPSAPTSNTSSPNSRPPSNGPPQLIPFGQGRSLSGSSSPAMSNQPMRPSFPPGPPNFDRNTPPGPPNLRPSSSSLPPSLRTSPTRHLHNSLSSNNVSGPPMFRPPVNGVHKMPGPTSSFPMPLPPTSEASIHHGPSFPPQPLSNSSAVNGGPPTSAIPRHPLNFSSQRPGPPSFGNQPVAPPTFSSQPPGPPTFNNQPPGPPTVDNQGFQPSPPNFNPPTAPPVMQPPPPPTSATGASRLGAAGLKAKRPVPSYNFNQAPPNSAPLPGNSLPGTHLPPQANLANEMPHPGSVQPPPAPGGMHTPVQPMEDPATQRMRQMSLSELSFINLMEHRNIFPKSESLSCLPPLPADLLTKNKYPEHFCSTLNVIPSSSGMLSKLKVPFGLVIQPFKNLEKEIPVVHPPIPRCKVCRTYVNPYVQLNDGARRWKCNICARLNDMPPDYFYGEDGKRIPFDVASRPELNSALVEYIAPSEYTTRPPQAATYLYLIDVSIGAVQSGMVKMACKVLEEELESIPGDSRKSIGIICFDSKLHYFNLHKNSGQPQMLVVADLDEPFIPTIDELMVNMKEHHQKIKDLLAMIPTIFAESKNPDCSVGPALKAAKELIFRTGGRITLLLSRTPSMGVGTTKKRTDVSKLEGLTLSPIDDFYKSLALECTQKQVSCDLFLFPNDNIDVPTISAAAQYSSGSVFYYPQYHFEKNPLMAEKFVGEFRHYVVRPIAFEAVLRIRCTSGINIHSFFGNCFVRAHDLIALANVSPDVSFGVQTNIDDALHDNKLAIFQSALLYTSSKGDRRIRVHTLALPISSDAQTVYNNLNIDASVSLLAKMAVEKSNSASLGDAREALQYACIDPLIRYQQDFCPNAKGSGQLVVPKTQRLLPLYVSSLLKSKAFRLQNVSVDDRFMMMLQFKTLPIEDIMLMIYPRLFSVHNLAETWTDKNTLPPRLALTAEKLTRQGAFILQTHEHFIMWLGRHVSEIFVNSVYNVQKYSDLPEISVGLEHHDNAISDLVHDLISLLSKVRDVPMTVVSVREDARYSPLFLHHLVEDRSEGQTSYFEFLQKIQQQIG